MWGAVKDCAAGLVIDVVVEITHARALLEKMCLLPAVTLLRIPSVRECRYFVQEGSWRRKEGAVALLELERFRRDRSDLRTRPRRTATSIEGRWKRGTLEKW